MKTFSTWGITRNKTIPAKQKKTKPFFCFKSISCILFYPNIWSSIWYNYTCSCLQAMPTESAWCVASVSFASLLPDQSPPVFQTSENKLVPGQAGLTVSIMLAHKSEGRVSSQRRKKKKKKTSTWKYFSAHFHHPRRACRRMLNWCTRCPECTLCSYFLQLPESPGERATAGVVGQLIKFSSLENSGEGQQSTKSTSLVKIRSTRITADFCRLSK